MFSETAVIGGVLEVTGYNLYENLNKVYVQHIESDLTCVY
jgi:hypothetical protein